MHPLTDAFIQGRAKYKKTTGVYFDKPKNPKAACALGAMYWGVYQRNIYDQGKLATDFPELLTHVPVPCEDAGEQVGEIRSILVHLNDEHDGRSGWTDTKIAEWLEGVLKNG